MSNTRCTWGFDFVHIQPYHVSKTLDPCGTRTPIYIWLTKWFSCHCRVYHRINMPFRMKVVTLSRYLEQDTQRSDDPSRDNGQCSFLELHQQKYVMHAMHLTLGGCVVRLALAPEQVNSPTERRAPEARSRLCSRTPMRSQKVR